MAAIKTNQLIIINANSPGWRELGGTMTEEEKMHAFRTSMREFETLAMAGEPGQNPCQ